MSYYITNQRGKLVNISADEFMAEFCISKVDIAEHLQAQIRHFKEKDNTHKIQPVMIGVSTSKFQSVVDHLCTTYSGFLRSYFVNRNSISIKMMAGGSEIIRIVDEELISQNND